MQKENDLSLFLCKKLKFSKKKKYSAEKEKIRNDHFSQQRSALDWCQCVSAAEIKTEKTNEFSLLNI